MVRGGDSALGRLAEFHPRAAIASSFGAEDVSAYRYRGSAFVRTFACLPLDTVDFLVRRNV